VLLYNESSDPSGYGSESQADVSREPKLKFVIDPADGVTGDSGKLLCSGVKSFLKVTLLFELPTD
jgi:hypothetical protein